MATVRLALAGFAALLIVFMNGWVATWGAMLTSQDLTLRAMSVAGTVFGIMILCASLLP